MSRRALIVCLVAASWAAPLPAAAQRYVALSFSLLAVGTARVNDLVADQTNRVWIATGGGVTAMVGGQRAPFFPVRSADGLLDNDVLAATVAPVGGQENFFLGFPNGIQRGRVTSTTGFAVEQALVTGVAERDFVRDLATDGTTTVWAATRGGLVVWALAGASVTQDGDPFLAGRDVAHAAAAPWGAVAFAAGSEVFLVRNSDPRTAPRRVGTLAGPAGGLAFDGRGNLWATTTGPSPVVRFDVNPTGDDLTGDSASFGFGPSLRTPVRIAADPFTRELWVSTTGADGLPARGAYSQVPDDADGVTPGGWVLDPQTATDVVFTVYSDPSGNTWFGTDRGVTARLVRLLTLDSSQYNGEGAVAGLRLEDLVAFQGNGLPGEAVTLQVSVGGTEAPLQLVEEGDSGTFATTFRWADLGEVPGPEGVAVAAEYAFADAFGEPRSLTASARWSNIVDFEDDLWIGGGPCFLRALGR